MGRGGSCRTPGVESRAAVARALLSPGPKPNPTATKSAGPIRIRIMIRVRVSCEAIEIQWHLFSDDGSTS